MSASAQPARTKARAGPSSSLLLLAAALASAVLGACGPAVRREVGSVRDVIHEARENGAYRCAPRELALAESHADFAQSELHDGNVQRARAELAVASFNARLALERSPRDRCNPGFGLRIERDSDGDGIPDSEDKCPNEPEDFDGFEDADGCPDPDNDQDGIPDTLDQCPNQPEDFDGFEDADGCPDLDNDKDGIPDAEDRCPDQAGPRENGGCPDTDRDGDGVVDRLDKCPDVPGPAANGGCPTQKFIVVTKEKIELKQKVHFATAKAVLFADCFPMLDEIAEVLRSRPSVRVRIEGHTDSRGGLKRNQKLSQSRAEAVRRYLISRGIEPSQMEARGFGPAQPIDDNRTARGREQNRRVEFIITAQ